MFDAFDTGADRDFAFDEAQLDLVRDARALVCAACRHAITREDFVTVIAGSTVHTRTNPHGHTYTFRMFADAPGCRAAGAATTAYTWFPPHAWQLAHCRACREHLGWRFVDADDLQFFALIENRLSEEHPA